MSPTCTTCTWFALLPVALLLRTALSTSDFPLGARFAVHLPAAYRPGFTERTAVLEAAGERQPRFAAALSVEAAGTGGGGYLCSLIVLLGNVTVWTSDRPVEEFAARGLCQLELTADGQLRLTDGAAAVGWWSATAGRGSKALHLDSKTGNLILLDAKNHTVWQSFDKPTDKLLQGQWLRLPSYLAVSLTNPSSAFYCIELVGDKIAAYLFFGQCRYSYWELTPSSNQSMAFAAMDGSGLTMFDRRARPVVQITAAVKKAPVRFLALGDDGNLGLYIFDRRHKKFRASYKALGFCDLPLACGVRGVCSAAGNCSDFSAYGISRPARRQRSTLCNATAIAEAHDMVEVRGVATVLKTATPLINVTARQCAGLCLRSCSCAAALYVKDVDAIVVTAAAADDDDDNGVCSHYELTAGVREVIGGSSHRYSYWVKVQKGRSCQEDEEDYSASNAVLTKILIIFGAVDVMCLFLFAGLCVYCFLSLRKRTADKHVTGEGDAAGDDGRAAEPNSNANIGAVQDSQN